MKKNVLLILTIVLIAASMLAAVKPAQLTVKNRTADDLALYLYQTIEDTHNIVLFATVPFNSEREYSLPPGDYTYEVFGCEATVTGAVTIRGHFTLVFPNCAKFQRLAPAMPDGSLKFVPE